MRSLSGLQLGNDVLFLKRGAHAAPRERPRLDVRDMIPSDDDRHDDEDGDGDGVSRAASDPGRHEAACSEVSADSGRGSLFTRPGLGTVVFRRSHLSAGAFGARPPGGGSVAGGEPAGRAPDVRRRELPSRRSPSFDGVSVGSAASLRGFPWEEAEPESDEEAEPENCPLETFLAAQGLGELTPTFGRQKMDLEALLLCSDRDLAGIHVPLGPRKKLLDACRRRLDAIGQPEAIGDTEL